MLVTLSQPRSSEHLRYKSNSNKLARKAETRTALSGSQNTSWQCIIGKCMTNYRSTAAEVLLLLHSEEEAIYIIPSDDRVTVVFSTVFREETDKVFAKVFLQEFYDARRLPSIQAAPQVLYSNREPPAEIRHIPGLSSAENVGYVTFGASTSSATSRLTKIFLHSPVPKALPECGRASENNQSDSAVP